MIIIKNSKPRKGKKQFRVQYTGKNNEILAPATLLNSKQACWKNIHAMAGNFPSKDEGNYVYVKDETLPKPAVFLYNIDTKTKSKE